MCVWDKCVKVLYGLSTLVGILSIAMCGFAAMKMGSVSLGGAGKPAFMAVVGFGVVGLIVGILGCVAGKCKKKPCLAIYNGLLIVVAAVFLIVGLMIMSIAGKFTPDVNYL